eukprot:TRINITY_DN5839_c0_g2_i1.p2 TRINITY_DN5839_c0_g2~~TRINITY_DN5839_c0_g2_i1.p2  ORF type:complete len:315 (-),score=59.20 TRINITY_DN5839_c0_g2_i1:1243-2118(-)
MRHGNIGIWLTGDNIHLYPADTADFESELAGHTMHWERDSTISAVWINVHVDMGRYLPKIRACGFVLHHVEGDMIVLYRWMLADAEDKVPQHGTHVGGACGVLTRKFEDSSLRILVIREITRKGRWEFPGGAVERGQYFQHAAQREVYEEVGLEARTVEFLGVWDKLNSRYGSNSCYLGFQMELVRDADWNQLKIDPEEIVEAAWVDIVQVCSSGDPRYKNLPFDDVTKYLAGVIYSKQQQQQKQPSTATTTSNQEEEESKIEQGESDRSRATANPRIITTRGKGHFYLSA